eukprot:6485879-Amphidinium_carterae.1
MSAGEIDASHAHVLDNCNHCMKGSSGKSRREHANCFQKLHPTAQSEGTAIPNVPLLHFHARHKVPLHKLSVRLHIFVKPCIIDESISKPALYNFALPTTWTLHLITEMGIRKDDALHSTPGHVVETRRNRVGEAILGEGKSTSQFLFWSALALSSEDLRCETVIAGLTGAFALQQYVLHTIPTWCHSDHYESGLITDAMGDNAQKTM